MQAATAMIGGEGDVRVRRGVLAGKALPYLLVLPVLVLEAVLILYPIVRGALFSLEGPAGGLDLDNYRFMLADPDFWRMLGHTLVYTLTVVVAILVVALGVALLMNWSFRGRGLVRSILTVPWAIPDVPVAITFVLMLDPTFGVFNRLAGLLPFIGEDRQWLLDPTLAMAAVIIVTVWKGFPFYALVLLAALQNVPDELYDAARVDGAGPLAQFRHVTLPGVRDTIALLAVLAFIFSTQQFTLIWLITGGGPVDATTTLAPAIYLQAFRFYNFGYAGAIAVIGFLVSALSTVAFVVVQRRIASEP
ncbi:carbohydrate ABC transporter permease [Prosthecomicrobium pneumaticum]|uniref:Multiple sugar transport system permease protein n=1 Tax=Prosthecomicrobium pneumaticum TaxID=81895 RepID=A0A7W9FL26_9HYPH|nr:sugar ABC transporter permease [Prosthecomicrobium pneumaticum]MBB5752203.1 multiple sugar transport system permease protein [Prosthecomicrobium pneumaticum]